MQWVSTFASGAPSLGRPRYLAGHPAKSGPPSPRGHSARTPLIYIRNIQKGKTKKKSWVTELPECQYMSRTLRQESEDNLRIADNSGACALRSTQFVVGRHHCPPFADLDEPPTLLLPTTERYTNTPQSTNWVIKAAGANGSRRKEAQPSSVHTRVSARVSGSSNCVSSRHSGNYI